MATGNEFAAQLSTIVDETGQIVASVQSSNASRGPDDYPDLTSEIMLLRLVKWFVQNPIVGIILIVAIAACALYGIGRALQAVSQAKVTT